MKDPTLAQGNQVLSLILQKIQSSSQLQFLFASGILSDLLEVDARGVNRGNFRIFLGLDKPKKEKFMHRIAIRNLPAEDETIKEIVDKEIGNVKILNWELEDKINFLGPIIGSDILYPQCLTILKVYYEK